MTRKRPATSELQAPSKRVQTAAPGDEEHDNESDAESASLYCLSEHIDHDHHLPTPLTPFSPASSSAKYPSDLKTHVCPYDSCGKAFNRPARLSEHIRSHTNERIFNCDYENCGKTFLRASHLTHHVKSAHTAVRDYVCEKEGCGKTFVTGSRLRRHLAAHEGRDKYRCTEYPPCSETFRKHSTLQKHVMTTHLNRKPFPCDRTDPATGIKCTQAFDTSGHLRAHESRVHGGAKFICTECSGPNASTATNADTNGGSAMTCAPATFPTYALLQAHIKFVHPPTCPECARTCTSARELRRHLEITHGSVSLEERKIHPCSYPGCGRSFTKRGNLNVHVRTVHEGEKRFVCGETDLSGSTKIEGWDAQDSCGKRYGSKLALEEHVRTAHLGFKNAKAVRRERLGLSSPGMSKGKEKMKKNTKKELSSLAMLTGEGYADESGRHISCLIQGCAHRFYREYDLWLHMGSKHGLEPQDTQILFMQRAMEGGDQSFDVDFSMAQGFGGFRVDGPQGGVDHPAGNNNDLYEGSIQDVDMDAATVMYFDAEQSGGGMDAAPLDDHRDQAGINRGDGQDGLGAIDPRLTYALDS